MRKEFGDRKISRRTKGPEGDFVALLTLSHWIYIHYYGHKHFKVILRLSYGNKANSNKTLRKSKKEKKYPCLLLLHK